MLTFADKVGGLKKGHKNAAVNVWMILKNTARRLNE